MSCGLDCTPQMGSRVEPASAMNAAKEFIIKESVRLCSAAMGGRARAIVLTGSMSRDEATLKRTGSGWRVLGDATFLIVVNRFLEIALPELQQHIEWSLLRQGIRCKVVIIVCTTASLGKMKPSIYAYELCERGRVVWGDERVLGLIRRFTANDIPREDGWWLLCNRMIEQLEEAAANNAGFDSTALRYRIAKLYLAMAGCYLLLTGQYEPSYQQRAARMAWLAESETSFASPIPLRRFSNLVSQCTELKLHGDMQLASAVFPDWSNAIADAERVWRWALGEMTGTSPRESFSASFRKLASRQSLIVRAKGWLRAAYVSPSSLPRNGLRWAWLALSSSPRYLVYSAGSRLLFGKQAQTTLTPEQLGGIVGRLPLPPEKQFPLTWGIAARTVAHNFHLFVDSTRS
jgi:hypothetical protein